jgi:hypothetical protein
VLLDDVVYYAKACAELTAYTLVLAGAFALVENFVDRLRGRRA